MKKHTLQENYERLFGPIKENISPSFTLKDISSKARTPEKCIRTFLICRPDIEKSLQLIHRRLFLHTINQPSQ